MNENTILSQIPVLSFFTGGGFLDLGFEQAGFKIGWTNEINEVFAKLYSSGFTSWRHSQGINQRSTISEITSIELLNKSKIFSRAFNNNVPGFFGIIGGPPCPDFSSAGKHRGAFGERGRLTKSFINLICEIKPAFFVIENVSGLYKYPKHRTFLKEIEYQLKNNNYLVEYKILNALEYGVPQNRERIFIVGIQSKLFSSSINKAEEIKEWFPWPEPINANALTDFSWPGINKLGRKPSKPIDIPNYLCVNDCLIPYNKRSSIPNGNDIFNAHSSKFFEINEGDVSGKSFKRLHRFRYSPTACYGNNEVHLHPWEPRRLSLREAMRIQGIPDTYILPDDISLTDKFKLVSNGVPVPLSRAVANSMSQLLQKLEKLEKLKEDVSNGYLVK